MKSITALPFMLFICTAFCVAQQPKKYNAQFMGTVNVAALNDKFDLSVQNLEMPDVDDNHDLAHLQSVKKLVAEKFPRRQGPARRGTSSVPVPVMGYNFIADTLADVPPDNYMAINDSMQAVSVINQTIAIHDATTGAYLNRLQLSIFSRTIGLTNYMTEYRYDPKVVYDPEARRFICVMLAGTNQYNYIVMGFSQSDSPLGSWNFYKFYGDYTGDTTWFDYPAISFTHDNFYLTGNKIKYDSSWQAGFSQSLVYQVRKEDGYNGDSTLSYQIWDSIQYNGSYVRCLYPVNAGDQVYGPAQYFISDKDFSVLNDTIFLIKITDTIGAPGNNLTILPLVSSLSYGIPPDGRQPDTAHTLATNDNRVLGGFIAGNEIQFVLTSVAPTTGSSAIYHGVISNFATSPTVTGRMFSIDSLDMGYPNISYAGNNSGINQAIITFNYSGPRTFPAFGSIFFDGANYSDMLTVKSGDSSISILTQTEQRWGDYSGTQPQWGAPGVVWAEGIYGLANHLYGNYMAQLISPYFTGTTKVQRPLAASSLFPNPAMQYISFEFSVEQSQLVDFNISDLTGRTVACFPVRFCSEGRNSVQFNIASLQPGIYFFQGHGSNGAVVDTKKFIKN